MFKAELGLLLWRRRTLGILAGLAALPVVAGIALALGGGPSPGEGPPFLSQVTHNGVFLALAGLTVATQFFLPLAVSIVAGDSVAGEASMGTLRYLLARPVGRTRLLMAKAVGVAAFSYVAALVIAVAGVVAGSVLFPIGAVTTLSGIPMPLADGLVRTGVAALVVGTSMLGLGCVGIFISTLTDTPMGAMAATAGLFVALAITGVFPELDGIQPYLFTHGWSAYADVMRQPVLWNAVGNDVGLQASWAAVALAAAWARLTTADILS